MTVVTYHVAAARAALWTGKVTWWAKLFPRAQYIQNYKLSFKLCSWCIHKSWIPLKFSVVFGVFNMSSFVDYCATTPVLGGGLSPPNHTQSRTHWVNADFSDAQSDTRFELGTLGSPVRCLDHYTTPAVMMTSFDWWDYLINAQIVCENYLQWEVSEWRISQQQLIMNLILKKA